MLAGAPGAGASGAALAKPCSRQVQLHGAALGQSKPDHVPEHRFHSFPGPVFQCLTSLLGNRFSLQFNWNFSSSTLRPLPLGQTLRGVWLHLHLCSAICLWWACWGSWWTISRVKAVWSPLWIAPALDYEELKLMTCFNTKSQIMATGNAFK